MANRLAVYPFFYWDGSKENAVAAGDVKSDVHADVLAMPSAWVPDPPVLVSDLARVPMEIRWARGF